jgi:hypothetical protein
VSRLEGLEAEIRREESRLAGLEAEVAATKTQLAALREQLAAPPVPVVAPSGSTLAAGAARPTNAAKVALFRSLFRGREDVFPRRWENERKGTSGYSPVCRNEWPSACAARSGARAPRGGRPAASVPTRPSCPS